MDYDNDGILDFISGSYDPGDVYLFRGLGEGKYAKVKNIVDENDLPLVHHPAEFGKYKALPADDYSDEATTLCVASFGSWVAAADWDADGDLDMLIGSFAGELFLRENIGTRSQPKYSGESIQIEADGKAFKENCHTAPVVADWDGDGVFDLVVGSGDGSVGWYKNIGSAAKPEFGSRNLLVAPAFVRSDIKQHADTSEHARKFLVQKLTEEDTPIQGARAQICVCDYNNDGKLDLVVGDHSQIEVARELSEKEQARLDEISQQIEEFSEKFQSFQETLYGEKSKELPEDEKTKLEGEYQALTAEYMTVEEERKTFYKENRTASYVWVYLRNSNGAATVGVKDDGTSATGVWQSDDSDDSAGNAPVVFDAELSTIGNQRQLQVSFDIDSAWHLYADAGSAGNQEVSIQLELPDGVSAEGEWEKPAATMNPEHRAQMLYRGSGVLKQNLNIEPDAEGEIKVVISYQVCNERMCLPATREEIVIGLE